MHRLSFAFLCSLHFGDIADVTEININLLFGVLLEPLTPFVNDYLRNEDVQDFGCKNRLPPAANFVFAFPTPAAWHLTP